MARTRGGGDFLVVGASAGRAAPPEDLRDQPGLDLSRLDHGLRPVAERLGDQGRLLHRGPRASRRELLGDVSLCDSAASQRSIADRHRGVLLQQQPGLGPCPRDRALQDLVRREQRPVPWARPLQCHAQRLRRVRDHGPDVAQLPGQLLRQPVLPAGEHRLGRRVPGHRRRNLFYRLQVSPAPPTADFGDVPTNHPYFQFIEALSGSGITAGCGNGDYCPDRPITRGEMAVFLAKALGLQWP